MTSRLLMLAACAALLTGACTAGNGPAMSADAGPGVPTTVAADPGDRRPFTTSQVAQLREPWAMAFLPDGRVLVTQKRGQLQLIDPAQPSAANAVSGVPAVDYGGQGGLGDVTLHPQFARNGLVYLSYVEAGEGDARGAAVARARLDLDANGGGALSGLQVIWRQVPKVTGRGHYGHRIVFGPDGHLFISSGDRQKFDPAQDMQSNLGKIVRLRDDGAIPPDNPFASQGGVAAQVWSLGHRNVLGIAFDGQSRLWAHEMGPRGGDELNLVERGANYGWPIVSDGVHYDLRAIPDHATRPDFNAPKIGWTPAISPAGFLIYSGTRFRDWQGDGLIGSLSGRALVRVEFDGVNAREAARYDLAQRIREIVQGPDGDLWLLEDERDGSGGRLLRLSPAN